MLGQSLLALASAVAAVQAGSLQVQDSGTASPTLSLTLPSLVAPLETKPQGGFVAPVDMSNSTTTTFTDCIQIPTPMPNATSAKIDWVTAGAIPQQMQGSVVGLLGFCIMGLIML